MNIIDKLNQQVTPTHYNKVNTQLPQSPGCAPKKGEAVYISNPYYTRPNGRKGFSITSQDQGGNGHIRTTCEQAFTASTIWSKDEETVTKYERLFSEMEESMKILKLGTIGNQGEIVISEDGKKILEKISSELHWGRSHYYRPSGTV